MIKSSRTFGVEIEGGARTYHDIETLRERLGRKWRFDDDGSIRELLENPVELVSPILKGAEGEKEIVKVCNLLKDLQFNAEDPCCGLHVHLGAEEFKPKEEYIVLRDEEFNEFVKSENNVKDILDIMYLNTEAVARFHGLKTRKLLTSRYRNLGRSLLENGNYDFLGNYGGGSIWIGKDHVNIGGKSRKALVFYYIEKDELDRITDKYKRVTNACKKEAKELRIATADRLLDDKTVDLFRSIESREKDIRSWYDAEIEKHAKRVSGRYVLKVRSSEPTNSLINLFLFYLVFDEVFMGMLPEDRRNGNMYCAPLSDTFTVAEILACKNQDDFESLWYKERNRARLSRHKNEHYDDSRYHNVNFHSLFNRHGTVEIRSHGGTVSPNRILLWTALHQQVLDRIAQKKISRETLVDIAENEVSLEGKAERMCRLLDLPKYLDAYVRRMLNYFTGTNL